MKNIFVKKLKKFMKKSFVINLALLLTSIIIAFFLGEIFVRIYFPEPKHEGQLFIKEWNRDYKRAVFIPNAEIIDYGISTKINSLGLKNKEIDLHKPKNVLRISMFGDSFTYGAGLPMYEALPSQLENRLNMSENDSIEIQVLNFGVSGFNTFQEIMYALNYGLKFNPDIIVVVWLYNDIEMNEYALKDFEYFTKNRTVPKSGDRVSHTVIGEAVGSYKGSKSISMRFWNFYDKLKRKSKLIYIVGKRTKRLLQNFGLNLKKSEEIIYSDLESDGFKLSFNSIEYVNNQLKELGIEFFVAIYPPLQKLEDDYYNDLINKKVENWCMDNNIRCLNLFDFFRGHEHSRLHVSRTDAHPSRYANEIASKAIEKYLKQESPLLRKE